MPGTKLTVQLMGGWIQFLIFLFAVFSHKIVNNGTVCNEE